MHILNSTRTAYTQAQLAATLSTVVKVEVSVLLYDAQAGTAMGDRNDTDNSTMPGPSQGVSGPSSRKSTGPSSRGVTGPSINLFDPTDNYMMGGTNKDGTHATTIEELHDSDDDEDSVNNNMNTSDKPVRTAGPPPMSAGVYGCHHHLARSLPYALY